MRNHLHDSNIAVIRMLSSGVACPSIELWLNRQLGSCNSLFFVIVAWKSFIYWNTELRNFATSIPCRRQSSASSRLKNVIKYLCKLLERRLYMEFHRLQSVQHKLPQITSMLTSVRNSDRRFNKRMTSPWLTKNIFIHAWRLLSAQRLLSQVRKFKLCWSSKDRDEKSPGLSAICDWFSKFMAFTLLLIKLLINLGLFQS